MKKSNALLNVINIFLILIIIVLYFLHIDYNLFTIGGITIIGLIINILIIIRYYYNYKSLKSSYFLFQFLSIPFLYGQLTVRYIFNYIPSDTFDLSRLVTMEYTIKAVFLIILCQLFLDLGYNIYKSKKALNNENSNVIDDKVFLRIGYILIAISIIPTAINYYDFLRVSIVNGYGGKIASSSYGIFSVLSKITPFFYIGILCLIYGYKENKHKAKFLLLFGVLFYGSQMFFGNRGMPLLMVICLVWFYHYYIRNIKFKYIIGVLFMSFLLIALMNVIRENRRYGMEKWISDVGTLVKESIVDKNPLLDLNYEVGTTIYPITYTLEHIPKDINYKYGKNYLYALYSIVKVNTSSTRDNDFTSKMNIAEEIVNHSGATFGGSYIQEAYGNFGWFCVIFMFFLGMVLKKLDIYLSNTISPISCILVTYFLTSLLWVIRNTMISLPREVAWYMFPTYIIYLIVLGQRKRNS